MSFGTLLESTLAHPGQTAEACSGSCSSLEDGEPYDPAVFVTVIPAWGVGEEFLVTAHQRLRILAIATDIDDELVERGFNAVWTVESA
jgi:hypothetical protein